MPEAQLGHTQIPKSSSFALKTKETQQTTSMHHEHNLEMMHLSGTGVLSPTPTISIGECKVQTFKSIFKMECSGMITNTSKYSHSTNQQQF